MSDIFETIIDIMLAVLVLFIFPMLFFGQRQDTISQNIIQSSTSSLVDTVRTQGFITKNMYDKYLENIDKTNVIGEVELLHKELVIEPEYRFKTLEEIIDDQNNNWKGTNVYNYVPVSTDVPYVVDPIDNTGLVMNTETNETVIAKSVPTPADPGHVHTDACYLSGVKHTHTSSCYDYESIPCGGYVTCYTSDVLYGGNTGQEWGLVTESYYCSSCSTSYGDITFQWGLNGSWSDVRDRTSASYGDSCTSSSSTRVRKCGKIEGAYYDGDTLVNPSCHLIVVDIEPTHPVQTLYINEPIITTVKVTYLDGSTNVRVASANFTPIIVVRNKVVALTYSGKSKDITITVIPKSKVCVNGHTYNLRNDGTDPGCIYCDSWLLGLVVYTPPTGMLTIYRGSSLEAGGVIVLATYMNGRKEYLYSGYAHNLDNNYVGTQTVTISYKGKYASLIVITKRNLKQCSVCRRYYELLPDGTDPGCPYCAALIPVFTGNVMRYYTVYTAKEILEELYEGTGTYYFKVDDYFNVTTSNRNQTFGSKVVSAFIHNVPEKSIRVNYGGVIRDEK